MALGHVDQRLSGFTVVYYAAAADLAFYAVAEGLVTAVLASPRSSAACYSRRSRGRATPTRRA